MKVLLLQIKTTTRSGFYLKNIKYTRGESEKKIFAATTETGYHGAHLLKSFQEGENEV